MSKPVEVDRRHKLLARLRAMRDELRLRREPATRDSVPYTVFDAASGIIVRSGSSQRRDLHRKATTASEIVIEGEYRDDQFRFEVTADGPVAVPHAPMRVVTQQMVKDECQRRIFERYPAGKQLTLMDEGGAPLDRMRAFRDVLRETSGRLESMTPIPNDFDDDKYWTGDNDA